MILDALERKSDITLADLLAELAGHGIGVSVAGLWRFFKRRRITLKKEADWVRIDDTFSFRFSLYHGSYVEVVKPNQIESWGISPVYIGERVRLRCPPRVIQRHREEALALGLCSS